MGIFDVKLTETPDLQEKTPHQKYQSQAELGIIKNIKAPSKNTKDGLDETFLDVWSILAGGGSRSLGANNQKHQRPVVAWGLSASACFPA